MNAQTPIDCTTSASIAQNWTDALIAFQAASAAHDAQGRRWQAAHEAGEDTTELDAEGDATYGAREDAFDVLLATPPADAAALALKVLLHSQRCDDGEVGFADPAFALDVEAYGAYAARGSVQFYRDAVGLAALAA
jgi:hypothetical protein